MGALTQIGNALTRNLSVMFPGYFAEVKRNHYADFGYPTEITFKLAYDAYLRIGVARAAVDKTVELLAVARANKVPVIHVKGGLDPKIAPWIHRRGGLRAQDPELARKGAEFIAEVAPIEGEVVIEKTSASPFWGTPLLMHLQGLGIDTLIVGGESTSGCVRATVVDGATNRFRMGVVAECVSDRTEASHFINLYDMHQKYADVVPLESAKDYLNRISNAPAAAA